MPNYEFDKNIISLHPIVQYTTADRAGRVKFLKDNGMFVEICTFSAAHVISFRVNMTMDNYNPTAGP